MKWNKFNVNNIINFNINNLFSVDCQGNEIADIINIKTYQNMGEDLDEVYCKKAYAQAGIEIA